jgi:outer membrane receptor for ferric coprogen and ferric-rhodotorulic acid
MNGDRIGSIGKRRNVLASILAMLLGAWGPLPTFAEEIHAFKVSSAESVVAIREFGLQSGTQILVAGDGLTDKKLNAVEGELSTDEGLRRLLAGTGLVHRYVGDRAIALVPAESVAAVTALRLSQAGQAGSGVQPAGEGLDEVVVTGKVVFTQNDAFGATKMGLPLKDTPQTVNVVTSDLIDVASIHTFEDFYKVDASSGTTHALDGYPRNFYRGFYQQGINAVRVDGFRMPGNINLDLAMFDRFEVIKGPTSTLYGQNNVGGALNAVSKLPQRQFAAELDLEAGQFDQYRADADVTGPIGDTWSYRLLGSYADSDSFIDYVGEQLGLVSAAVQYAPGEATRFTLRATRQRTDGTYHYAPALQLRGNGTGPVEERVRAEGLGFIDVPRSRFFGMPWNGDEKQVRFVQFQGEHEFANGWRLRAHAQHSELDQDALGFYVGGPFDERGFGNFLWNTMVSRENSLDGGEINLFGDVRLFGREHTLFFGIDRSDVSVDNRNAGTASFGYEGSYFNAYAPDYSTVPRPQSFDDYPFVSDSRERSRLTGATVQVILRPIDRLSLLIAGRQSRDTLEDGFRGAGSVAELEAGVYDRNERRFGERVRELRRILQLAVRQGVRRRQSRR